MNIPLITNIQRYSIHDGDGIRTTIFFKGCPLSCSWCHNPETQKYEKELFYHKENCIGCLKCIDVCKNNAIYIGTDGIKLDKSKCTCCGECIDYCAYNAREIIGRKYEIEELVNEIEKDSMFYEVSNGGVTLSGGEVMAQDIDYIEELTKILYERGYDITIDTSGCVPYERFKKIIPYVSTVLFDIKLMDSKLHKMHIGIDNKLILDNLKSLSKENISIYLRLPLIDEINCDNINIVKIIGLLKKENIRIKQINLLPYHEIGAHKYTKLQKNYNNNFNKPSEERLNEIINLFNLNGFNNVKIGG